MRCEEALDRLNARADGELLAADAAELDAHLAECGPCRAAGEGLAAIDAELRRAFAGRREAAARVAERTAAAVRASAGTGASMPQRPAPRVAWGQMLVGLAAGFLLAVGVFRPWQEREAAPIALPTAQPVARLAVASGPVEVRPASQLNFFACPTESPIQPDSIVRTGPTAQCEIALADGNALRLDCNTEVTLREPTAVEVSRGRLWSSSPPGRKARTIQSGGGTIVPQPASQLAVDCQPNATRLVVVGGTASVQTGTESIEVGPGKQVRIVQGKLEQSPEACDALLETAWVNSVLAQRGAEHPELVDRVNRLVARLGAAGSTPHEDELRRLGDDGVPAMLAYLASTRETPKIAQRAAAARIVADVAQARWIAELIALLTDANADVRYHAAAGLARLTGRDQGCDARSWQTETWTTCETPYQKWLDWWATNRDRYPAARRDIPSPKQPPF
jgi:anti-sigma factor RsiW